MKIGVQINRFDYPAADRDDTYAMAQERAKLGIDHMIFGVSKDANVDDYAKLKDVVEKIHAL